MLNLLGPLEPSGIGRAELLVWGNVAGWSDSYYLVWGSADAVARRRVSRLGHRRHSGEYLVWGTGVDAGREQ